MKRICSLVAIFLSIGICYGQEFLTSFDYVYGCASNEEEAVADSLALLSFAKCVNVKVNNVSNYSFEETKFGSSETYKNDVSVSSSVDVSGLKKYVEHIGGTYTVYYYFNKKKYVDDCLVSYNENIEKANSAKGLNHPHADNIYLGYLYLAYLSVSNDMFQAFYPNGKQLKNIVCDEISNKYKRMDYILSSRNVGSVNPSGINLVREENSKILPGFEYKTKEGVWMAPEIFVDENDSPQDKNEAKWAYVFNSTEEYRFSFEINTNIGIRKIDVPDGFYSKYAIYKHF